MAEDTFERFLREVSVEDLQQEVGNLRHRAQKLLRRAEAIERLISLRSAVEEDEDESSDIPPVRELPQPQRTGKSLVEIMDGLSRLSLPEAILGLMKETPGTLWTAEMILSDLERAGNAPRGKTPRNSIQATLSRMVADGQVVRRGRGVYELPSETSDGDSAGGATPATLLDEGEE